MFNCHIGELVQDGQLANAFVLRGEGDPRRGAGMTCGGAIAAAVLREGMAVRIPLPFRCRRCKRAEIPLPTDSAKPIQATDYNGFAPSRGALLGARKTVFPCWQGKALRGRWRSAWYAR